MQFIYQPHPVRIIFGDGLINALRNESDSFHRSMMLIATSRFDSLAESISKLTGYTVIHHVRDVIQHVPEEQVKEALDLVQENRPDLILAIGGGSSVGLAKAIAFRLEKSIPIWAAPSTYSGSEMTNIYGISADGKKEVGRSSAVLPERVFYDPALSASLPYSLASKSAVNAMAHLVEAVYSKQNNPFSYRSALQGIETLVAAMKNHSEQNRLTADVNELFLFGGCLAGKALCEVNMGLHHKSAHVLGGNFGMDHSSVHTVLLPYVFAYQWAHLQASIRRDFINVFGAEYPPSALLGLNRKMKNPMTLEEIGFNLNDLPAAVEDLLKIDFSNPAPITKEGLIEMLNSSFKGHLINRDS